jgi:hypothetical protein
MLSKLFRSFDTSLVALTFTLDYLTSLDAKRVDNLSRATSVILNFLDTRAPAEFQTRLNTLA